MYAEGERSGKIRIPSWMEIEISNNGDGLLNLVPLNATVGEGIRIPSWIDISVIGSVQEDSSKFSVFPLDETNDDYIWIFKETELKNFYFGVQNNTVIGRINKLYRSSSIGSVNNNILTMTDVSTPTIDIESEKIILVLGTE